MESLSAQTDQRFRVIVGDDHSPESPEGLINEYNTNFFLQYIRFEKNLGQKDLAAQWSRCLKYADTEWFMILGDDDVLSPECISEFYSVLKHKMQSDSVMRFHRQVINSIGEKVSPKSDFPDRELSSDFIYKRSQNQVVSSLSEYIFRTEDFKKHGIISYPNGFYSDNWMLLVYSDFGRIKNINETCYIRITINSLSGNPENREKVSEAALQFYRDLLTTYSQNFTRIQKSLFLNILIKGVNDRKFLMNEIQFLKLSLLTVGWPLTLRKVLTLIKMKLNKS